MIPTITVLVEGQSIAGLIRAVIHSTNCFEADQFSLTLALGPWPLTNISFWASVSSPEIEITVVLDGVTETLLVGTVDFFQIDPIRGTVTIEGRDLSAKLIDSYWQQDFVNQTASEIVTTIVQQYGLIPIVSPTTEIIGRKYDDGYTRLSLGQFSKYRSNWDVIVQLARENQFDTYVDGRSFYFQPTSTAAFAPISLQIADVVSLHVECSQILTDSPAIRVQSWNSQDKMAYANAPQPSASEGGDAGPFLFTSANLTDGQVESYATFVGAELTRQSTVLQFEMPLDLAYSPRTLLLLSGTDSAFDTYYSVDSVEREFCATTGVTQRVRAIVSQERL